MGLDTVDLIIRMEQEFGIKIPDNVAPRLGVLGNLHSFIIQELRERGENPDEDNVWNKLKEIVVDQLGVRPDEVTKAADIVRDLKAD